jgi:hypothetical protein
VSVEPVDGPSIWHLAALLTSPVATAWLVTEAAGTRCRPLPSESRLQRSPRSLFRTTSRRGTSLRKRLATEMSPPCGRAMLQAHAVDDDALFAWWWDRMPTR